MRFRVTAHPLSLAQTSRELSGFPPGSSRRQDRRLNRGPRLHSNDGLLSTQWQLYDDPREITTPFSGLRRCHRLLLWRRPRDSRQLDLEGGFIFYADRRMMVPPMIVRIVERSGLPGGGYDVRDDPHVLSVRKFAIASIGAAKPDALGGNRAQHLLA